MEDYSRLGSLTVEKTGLLSNASVELRNFIIFNRLEKVKDFIEGVDNRTYTSYLHNYILTEARGLSDLLKQKYFNVSLVADIYLDRNIKQYRFNMEISPILMYGVLESNGEKKSIYQVITRLGFNNKERDIILEPGKEIEDMLVIDLLHETHDKLVEDSSEFAKVLREKILLILKYYLVKKKKKSDFNIAMEKRIEEFNDALARRLALEGNYGRRNGVVKK